jgi:hypothetical protein
MNVRYAQSHLSEPVTWTLADGFGGVADAHLILTFPTRPRTACNPIKIAGGLLLASADFFC